jgi:hypothetical protein
MLDTNRAKIQSHIDNAATLEEAAISEALLKAYDSGELMVLTDIATGNLLFNIAPLN